LKLLGLRICDHDSNFSYFDGEKVNYLKTERKYQFKHHSVMQHQENKKEGYDWTLWEKIIEEEWDIRSKDLDEIAIVFDPWFYNFNTRNDIFFPSRPEVDFKADCKVTRVNHHWAHHLSCWPLVKDPHKLNGFSYDGFGDYGTIWTLIEQGKCKVRGDTQYISIGNSLGSTGVHFDVKANHNLDLSGKMMALQSYGQIDKEFYEFLKQYSIEQVEHIFDVNYYRDRPQPRIDWLRTVHQYAGDLLLDYISKHFKEDEYFCYTGGVALNVNWNTQFRKKFKNIIIPPHPNDDGLSLGALEYLRMEHNLSNFKLDNFPFCQSDESPNEIPSEMVMNKTVELLKNQKIVGWYQGHGEIGPRALGNRSILADPRDKDMREKVNNIKKREEFRPFGCSTINKSFSKSPYMLYADPIDFNKYPAVSHVDGTCRHQTIENNEIFFQLIEKFYNETNCDVLLNTSLNVNGKPIAAHKKDALELLHTSELDALVYGNDLWIK
jgi:carbamoyltransferase